MKKALIFTTFLAIAASSAVAEQPGSPDDGPRTRKMVEYNFVKMDTNGDGFVTKDEVVAYAQKMFDEADTNHDGKLTQDEMFDQKMREKTAFKDYLGKNTSDTSNATKDKAN